MTIGNAWEIVDVYTSLKEATDEAARLEAKSPSKTFKIMHRWDGFYTLFVRVKK